MNEKLKNCPEKKTGEMKLNILGFLASCSNEYINNKKIGQ